MSLLHRARNEPRVELTPQPPDTDATATAEHVTQPAETSPVPSQRVPRTRTGSAWAGIVAATLIAVGLIVFLAQSTRSTEVSFLWMTTSTSLAVALVIAAVGSVLLTLIVGTARITQLRHLIRKSRG